MKRTDTRNLAERKHSVTLRIGELRKALNEAERCSAEIDIQIEAASQQSAADEKGSDSVAAE